MPEHTKRYRLDQLKLDEISLVDVPANAQATVSLYKRGNPMKMDDLTDAQKAKAKEYMDKGMDETDAMRRAMRKSSEASDGAGEPDDHGKESDMDVNELKEQLEAAEANQTALEAALEKAGYAISKGDDGSVTVEKKAEEEFVEVNGEKIAKSALPEPVLKQLQAQQEQIERLAKAEETTRLEKKGASLPNLGGSDVAKGRLLEAVDKIEGGEDILTGLTAADKILGQAFVEKGRSGGADEANGPESELRKMAQEYAAEKGCSYEQAFTQITKSGKGRELLLKSASDS